MRSLKVIIACGSGAVTSTMCGGVVKELAAEKRISVDVTTCSIMEFEAQREEYDVKFTTMAYKFPEGEKYTLNIFPLITGINAAVCKEKIAEILLEAAQDEENR